MLVRLATPALAVPSKDAADQYVQALQTGNVDQFLASLAPQARTDLDAVGAQRRDLHHRDRARPIIVERAIGRRIPSAELVLAAFDAVHGFGERVFHARAQAFLVNHTMDLSQKLGGVTVPVHSRWPGG